MELRTFRSKWEELPKKKTTLPYKCSKKRIWKEDVALSEGKREGFIRKVLEVGERFGGGQGYRAKRHSLSPNVQAAPRHGESICGTSNTSPLCASVSLSIDQRGCSSDFSMFRSMWDNQLSQSARFPQISWDSGVGMMKPDKPGGVCHPN